MWRISEVGEREVHISEVDKDTEIRVEGGELSTRECMAYWDELFEKQWGDPERKESRMDVQEEREHYYDDHGELYRLGTELLPNTSYEINGYRYETDDQGRIVSVEGMLHVKNREGRLPIRDSLEDIGKGDERQGDDRGHLIGDQFDGSNGLENMVPQNAEINRNAFKDFENELAREVKAGKEVAVKLEVVYDGDSRRPTAIVVQYSIDGEESMRIFPND